MSSSGIQNYLSNVFRQVYVYDNTAAAFIPRLELSNIDTYSGNSVSVFTAAVGDSASNVYVGSNAGNAYNTIRACSNVTAIGYGAGSNISNVSNSVYFGFSAGVGAQDASSVIAIGVGAIGGGTSNIAIGNGTGTVGVSNVLIGHSIAPGNVSKQVRIGHSNRIAIAADLSYNWVGLGGIVTPSDTTYATIDVSGSTRIQGNVGINIAPGGRTLDVNGNFRSTDSASNILDFSNGLTTSTGGFASFAGSVGVSNGATTAIGTNLLKKGMALVSVGSGSANFDGRVSLVLNVATPTVVDIASSNSTTTSVTFTASNVNITNTTGGDLTYTYNITYFPLP